MTNHRLRRISFPLLFLFLFSCKGALSTPDLDSLNATRYPLTTLSVEMLRVTQTARAAATKAPTPTRSPLDMIASDPGEFRLDAGKLQFVEFFRYG